MAGLKELDVRIRSRYDTLSEWTAHKDTVPLQGEICVVVIPTTNNSYETGNSPDATGLTPYAIGIKIGDGIRSFEELPWIQAIAGDIYQWAKQPIPPSASNISATYNSDSSNVQSILNTLVQDLYSLTGEDISVIYNGTSSSVQDAISGIENSLGSIVASGVDPESLANALAQLADQLSGQTANVFTANQSGVTYKIDTIDQNGLTITTTSSPLVLSDISDLYFNTPYNSVTNKVATMKDIGTVNTNGLVQELGDYLILDCGTSSYLIN